MKKLNNIPQSFLVIIVFILLVAVGTLFFLQFKSSGKSDSDSAKTAADAAKINSSIAYINLDSVYAQYQMSKDLADELQIKGKQMEAELAAKSKNLQAGVQDLQYKAQKGLEISSKLQEMQQKLALEEQNLYKLRENYASQMQEENGVMLRKVMNDLMEYLKEYNKSKNFHYILGNTFDGKILYANDSLNITKDVINGLNKRYAEKKQNSGK